MKLFRGGWLAAAIAMALAGCHLPGQEAVKSPTGQVVAKVGNREITLRELQAEMGNASLPDPKARKTAEQIALSNIVGRIVLADAAKQQGLDKTPDYDIQKTRVLDNLLVQELQQKITTDVPQPTKLEADEFVNTHRDIFAERKVFSVDQIRMPRPSDVAVLKSLEPLKTLEQVEGVLKTDKIPYQRAGGSLDAVGADPRLVDQIMKLPPNEVFVIPGANGLLVNQIRDTKVIPFTGDQAVEYASQVLMRQRVQDAVQKSFAQLFASQRGRIQFNKEYEPPKPNAAASPAKAGATAPAASGTAGR